MLLENLQIQGYRSLSDINIDISKLNIIVGSNDSGKSNILRAINLFLQPNMLLSEVEHSIFLRLDGIGSVKDNSVNFVGRLALNQDNGSATIRKAISNLAQINTVSRTNDNYEVNYVINNVNGTKSNTVRSQDGTEHVVEVDFTIMDLGGGINLLKKRLEDTAGVTAARPSKSRNEPSL